MRHLLLPAVAALAVAAPAFAASPIVVSDAWVRAAPNGAPTGAAYLTVTNKGPAPDRLLGGETSAARVVQIHEMSMTNGVMHMAEIKGGAVIAPGASLKLQPGGWHLMLIGLKGPLAAGGQVSLTLRFEQAGLVKLTLPVKAAPPMGGMAMHH